uniref:Uncharacterized protein n=1 Tax=viral metagenome TaxID=1070528 RepID=A0A6C0H4T8_9ZZZZ
MSKLNKDIEKRIKEYVSEMTPIERKAMEIAKNHLGTSFNIEKSNGFREFLKKKNYN